MIIIHGDNNIASYRRLSEFSGVHIFDANQLTLSRLRQETQPQDLFGNTSQIVIKDIISSAKSKSKDACLEYLVKNQQLNIVLYEKKNISATILKKFNNSKIELFKIESNIFRFLDNVKPKNQQKILSDFQKLLADKIEPEYLFAMIVRQFRLLIQAKFNPKTLSIPPYPTRLVVAQSGYFDQKQLLNLHHQLFQIEKGVKTGLLPGGLELHLQHFLLSI